MDLRFNPYSPGAGIRPPLLAGRDDLVSLATTALERAKNSFYAKSFVAVGLRGVGKTVVLNEVQQVAEAKGYYTIAIEAHDDASLVHLLVPKLRSMLLKISRIANASAIARRGLSVLKNFANALQVKIGEIELGLDFHEEDGIADSGDLANDLPELLEIIGEIIKSRNSVLAIIIDEIQYLSESELGALIMAMHRVTQKAFPVVLIGAGLPQVLANMGKSKSYAERLFDFPRVEALDRKDSQSAIAKPAIAQGVEFFDDALSEIFNVTEGYPYFLQEWGYVVWNLAKSSPIPREVILEAHSEATKRLDESFFRVRLKRMNPTERRYMRAMAELGVGPHTSGDIAKVYGAKVSTVAPIRSSLIAKGMIYSPSYGNTAFTVPLFDQFMRRQMPDWSKKAVVE